MSKLDLYLEYREETGMDRPFGGFGNAWDESAMTERQCDYIEWLETKVQSQIELENVGCERVKFERGELWPKTTLTEKDIEFL